MNTIRSDFMRCINSLSLDLMCIQPLPTGYKSIRRVTEIDGEWELEIMAYIPKGKEVFVESARFTDTSRPPKKTELKRWAIRLIAELCRKLTARIEASTKGTSCCLPPPSL